MRHDRSYRLVLVVAAALLAGSCKSEPTGPEGPNVTGRWLGYASGMTFDIGMADEAGRISGAGNLIVGASRLAISISGTHQRRTVSFSISAPGYQNAGYSGNIVSDSIISGRLSESGFNGQALTLTKR